MSSHTYPGDWRNDLEAARREREDTRVELEGSNDVGMMHTDFFQGMDFSVVYDEMVMIANYLLLRSVLVPRRSPTFLPPCWLSGFLLDRVFFACGVLQVLFRFLELFILRGQLPGAHFHILPKLEDDLSLSPLNLVY